MELIKNNVKNVDDINWVPSFVKTKKRSPTEQTRSLRHPMRLDKRVSKNKKKRKGPITNYLNKADAAKCQ